MAWSSGSELMTEIIGVLKEHIPDFEIRQTVYKDLIVIFEAWDCDTLEECFEDDELFEEVYVQMREEYQEEQLDEDEF